MKGRKTNTNMNNEVHHPVDVSENSSASLFERPRDASSDQSVNLMDQSAEIYLEPKQRFRWLARLRSALYGNTSDSRMGAGCTDQHDFIGHVSDVINKEKGRFPSRPCCLMIAATFALLAVLLAVRQYFRAMTEEQLRARSDERFKSILDQILAQAVSNSSVFLLPRSAELLALNWVAYNDPAQLLPDDPILLERYSLAVFYYHALLTFQKGAGKQGPTESRDHPQLEGVTNPGWSRYDHWLSSKGICIWYGVECEAREVSTQEGGNTSLASRYDANAHVTALNLTGNHVSGILPPEMKGLRQLQRLDMSMNHIQGTLSEDIGHMATLTELVLNRNDLRGTIPSSFGLLQQVESLHLNRNHLTGIIPTELNRLDHLRSLSLHHNQLTGNIPDLGQCHELTSLRVNDNLLAGFFPFSLAKSISLKELRLHDNMLSGTLPPELESIHQLRYLQVNNNRLTGTLMAHVFTKLTHLSEFQCQHNFFGGTVPHTFGSLSELVTLTLNNNNFTGNLGDNNWANLDQLQKLHLHDNRVTGPLPPEFGNLTNLAELWLHENLFTGTLPPQLGGMSQLGSLYLDNNQFTGSIPYQLSQLHQLGTLQLQGNGFSGTMPPDVCALTSSEDQRAHLSLLSADCKYSHGISCDCCHDCY